MELTILVDNNTIIDENYLGEPGLCYYIEEKDLRILFDVGYSDIFLRNAYKMNINPEGVNYVILSHGHLDHTWGMVHLLGALDYYSGKNEEKAVLMSHPMALVPKKDNGEQIGMIYSEEVLKGCFNICLSREPVWLTEKLVYLGEIERTNDFENKLPIGTTYVGGMETPDYIMDDTALAYKGEEGITVITGCSHSGICNIIEYARKVCREERVVSIIGGFHLLNPSEIQLKETMNYLNKLAPKEVYACHCTDLASKIALSGVVNIKEAGVGKKFAY